MGEVLEARRRDVDDRIRSLRERLTEAASEFGDRACVYLTGSYGRGEASAHSDLDLFIIGTVDADRKRRLSRLHEICLKSDLIRAADDLKYPPFSRDGEFLQFHTGEDLVTRLGTSRDDFDNTLTARLLLLLESKPLFGEGVYEQVVSEVLDVYWREFERHQGDFEPGFLANDILRLWRTFCLNFEARPVQPKDDPQAAVKLKLKNYKLKHSRLLTCYSGVAFLLAAFVKNGTVTREMARTMIGMTPTERIESVRSRPGAASAADDVLATYEEFLSATDASEADLLARLQQSPGEFRRPPGSLGDRMYELIDALGKGTPLHRRLFL